MNESSSASAKVGKSVGKTRYKKIGDIQYYVACHLLCGGFGRLLPNSWFGLSIPPNHAVSRCRFELKSWRYIDLLWIVDNYNMKYDLWVKLIVAVETSSWNSCSQLKLST